MGLFGPPNPEKLKNKRDIKGLLGALKYRRSALVRKNAALGLADLAALLPTQNFTDAIPVLIAALEDDDPAVVTGVVQALSAVGQPAFLPLVSSLRTASERGRESAARALGRLGSALIEPANLALAVDPLVNLLRDTNQTVRRAAAWALGRIAQRLDPAQRGLPIETLILCLHDSAAEVREAAVYSLGRMGEGRAIRPLITALDDPSAAVRKGASEALGLLGWQPNTPAELTSYRIARQDWQGASAFGSTSITALSRVAKESDVSNRIAAIIALGQTGSPEAVGALVTTLKDTDKAVRSAAAEALEKLGSAHAIEPLLAAVRDQDRFVRIAIARALSYTQDPRAVPPIINLLGSHDEDAIEVASEALVRLGSLSVPNLIALLTDANQFLIEPAGKILVKIGTSASQSLIILLQEGVNPANKTAAFLLGEIGDARAVRPLITALANPDLSVQAAQALGKIGDSRAVKPLLEALGSLSETTQRTAAQALGAIGDPLALEPILQLLRSSDRQTRLDAARALLTMYQSNKLTLAQKQKILEHRDKITSKHTDIGVHQDENRYDWHMDHVVHDDSGIGLSFPLDPKK